jgi:molybdopterin-binding protein
MRPRSSDRARSLHLRSPSSHALGQSGYNEWATHVAWTNEGMTMRISARNQLAGTVVSIENGAVTSIVVIRLRGGEQVVASITKQSVENLALQVGDEAIAIVKSSDVMVGKN